MSKISTLKTYLIVLCGIICLIPPVFAQDDFDFFDDGASSKETVVPAKDTQIKSSEEKPKVNVKQSLSDNLKQNTPKSESTKSQDKDADTSKDPDDPRNRETWLESLISKGTSELFKTQDKKTLQAEKKRIAKVLQNRHSNAANFDISNIKLRMNPSEIEKLLTAQGYRRISQETRIPNFIKWRSEELCRIHGIVGFERLKACAKSIAQANGFEYVAFEVYNRQSTRESLNISYTSTFTDNLSHRILYKSEVPISTSKSSEHVYINNLKIYDFWRRVDLRYGKPDNASEVKWGLGGKKPYLQASTGKLELVDPLLKDLDISRMLNEDSRLANTPYYTF